MFCRRGTNDDDVVAEVCKHNTYNLPQSLPYRATVIDIGCHIGAFARFCLERGAGTVYGYEASSENVQLARKNLAEFDGQAVIRHAAVVRSDAPPNQVYFSGYAQFDSGVTNTGGGNVYAAAGETCKTIALDDAIAGQVDILKLDCEGSEFPILLTCQRLKLVESICGEYHEFSEEAYRNLPEHFQIEGMNDYRMEHLERFLAEKGFSVTSDRYPKSNMGRFFARRP